MLDKTNDNNKHLSKRKKTFQTNIPMNDPYDRRLCGSSTV